MPYHNWNASHMYKVEYEEDLSQENDVEATRIQRRSIETNVTEVVVTKKKKKKKKRARNR